jgi:NADPH:quinone reductase-like Zn-dependent oxidoreductase
MRAEPILVRLMGEGFLRPKKSVPGIDMVGVVEKTGKNVTLFKAGDEVFGDIYKSGRGSYQEYVCVREDVSIVKKPAGITFEHAAAVTVAGLTALQEESIPFVCCLLKHLEPM